MVRSVTVSLQALRCCDSGVTSAEFLNPLNIRPGEVKAVQAFRRRPGPCLVAPYTPYGTSTRFGAGRSPACAESPPRD